MTYIKPLLVNCTSVAVRIELKDGQDGLSQQLLILPLENLTETRMATYRHTPDMGEISGFGGGYEACCQDMLEAGVKHIEEKKLAGSDVQISGYQGIYGLVFPENQPTKDLEAAVLEAAKGEATGAMHHAVMSRLAWIAREGWDRYCTECRKREAV